MKKNIRGSMLLAIESYIKKHGISATAFGKMCRNDTHFVHNLRKGRDIETATYEQVMEFMRGKR